VLLIGSSNLVHNTHLSVSKLRAGDTSPFAWATEVDEWVKLKLDQRDFQGLVDYQRAGTSGLLAVPTPDHYLPLLYSAGLALPGEEIAYPHEEVSFGGLSMRTVQVG
jgi:4,5-DOPA dioxygenase extradiol